MNRFLKKFIHKNFSIDLERIKNIIKNYNFSTKSILSLIIKGFLLCANTIDEKFIVHTKIWIAKKVFSKNYRMINIGGGDYFRKYWSVLDFPSQHYSYDPKKIQYIFDLTSGKPLLFKDNDIKFFFSAHTFEHIPQEHCQHIFNEFYRCLEKEGAVRITLPDFDKAYDAYGQKNINFFVKYPGNNIHEKFLNFFATYFMNIISNEEFERNYLEMKKGDFADYYTLKIPREYQKDHGGDHINWWNSEKAKNMLYKAGFRKIILSEQQKSKFHEMRGKGRKIGFDSTHPEVSFFIEALK